MIINFIGEVLWVKCDGDAVSLSWAIVPGTSDWNLYQGATSGDSQVCQMDGVAIANAPIDVVFHTDDLDGWPTLVVEVWDKSFEGMKGFVGCGTIWMPTQPGEHSVKVGLWKPVPSGLPGTRESFLPSFFDREGLRQLELHPELRMGMTCQSVGEALVKIHVAMSKFDSPGITFS